MSKFNSEPSSSEILASCTINKGASESIGAVKATSLRIPIQDYAEVEAISDLSNLPRNKVLALLVSSGLEMYRTDLGANKKIFKEFEELSAVQLKKIIDSNEISHHDSSKDS